MHRSKAALSLLARLALAVGMLGCGEDPPDGTPQPTGGTGGDGGTGGAPTGGTGGTGGIGGIPGTGGTGGGPGGTGGTGGVVVPGDCASDPGQESCARCLEAAMPFCLMQSATDCPDPLGAYLVCSNDNGCMKDNGLPSMDCSPCVSVLSSALGCLQSCQQIADCL